MSHIACVTGATGFLGRHLVRALCQREDFEVRCLLRPTSSTQGIEDTVPLKHLHRVRFIRLDYDDPLQLSESISGAGVVYHLAASLTGETSAMFENTLLPTRKMLEASQAARVHRFVLVSSLGVYGTAALRAHSTLTEETPIDPAPAERDPYTFTKIHQENVARQLAEDLQVPLVVVRPGVIYGPGRSPLSSRIGIGLGPCFVQMGNQTLPYTYVENCAEAIAQAGNVPGIEGETFNVIDDDLPTGSTVIKLMRKSGRRVRSIWVPRVAIGPLSSIYHWYAKYSQGELPPAITPYKSAAMWKPLKYSNQKAKDRLHWEPAVTTQEGLRRTILN